MKIAILNPYKNVAETESAKRIIFASKNLNIEAKEFHFSYELDSYEPDLVLAISHQNPKLTKYPTYGVLTAPISYYKQNNRFIRNILSYDGVFTVSELVKEWLENLFQGSKRFGMEVGYYANTCSKINFENEIDFSNPSLAYFGTNWCGNRHTSLMSKLSENDFMNFYGPESGWKNVNKNSFKGQVPFDGFSVYDVYRKHGLGLCMYDDEFVKDALPNNRIFEIVASGAYCISSKNIFSESIFGDSVFHFDQSSSPDKIINEIKDHIKWIKSNSENVALKAEKAKKIFDNQLCLEVLLKNVVNYHNNSIEKRGYIDLKSDKKIAYIIRTGDRPKEFVNRALKSLENQSFKNIIPIIVTYKIQPYLKSLLSEYKNIFSEIIHVESMPTSRSKTLWDGIKYIQERSDIDYFGILDDDDELFPNHVQGLINYIDRVMEYKNIKVDVCYSGSIQKSIHKIKELMRDDQIMEIHDQEYSIIHQYDFFNKKKLSSGFGINTNSVLINTKLLDKDILLDPKLHVGEDLYLFLKLSEKSLFWFNMEITSLVNIHDLEQSNYNEVNNFNKIKFMTTYPKLDKSKIIEISEKDYYEILRFKKNKNIFSKIWKIIMIETKEKRNSFEKKIFKKNISSNLKKNKK